MYTEDEIKKANKTCRDNRAVGINAIVPRIIKEMFSPKDQLTFLDYGAGKNAIHTMDLRKEGYDVTAHDFGKNFTKGIHDPNALKKKYDVVFLSNVLNTQCSENMLVETMGEIWTCLKHDGAAIVNYPNAPRLTNFSTEKMEKYLSTVFNVSKIPNKNVIWKLSL